MVAHQPTQLSRGEVEIGTPLGAGVQRQDVSRFAGRQQVPDDVPRVAHVPQLVPEHRGNRFLRIRTGSVRTCIDVKLQRARNALLQEVQVPEEMCELQRPRIGIVRRGHHERRARVVADDLVVHIGERQFEHRLLEFLNRPGVQRNVPVLLRHVPAHQLLEMRIGRRGKWEVVVDAMRISLAVHVQVEYEAVQQRVGDDVPMQPPLDGVD